MATLDISVVVFALFVVLILDMIAIGKKTRWIAIIGFVFAISAFGYFISKFDVVGLGNGTTIPFELFLTAWVCLPILVSFILVIKP